MQTRPDEHIRHHSSLANRLRREVRGEVLFDAFSRGRYSTDASIYQIMPVGVVLPESDEDVQIAVQIANEAGVAVLPRGAGTSQNGQAIGAALVIDTTRHLNQVVDFDAGARTACVQPGLVLDRFNHFLKPHGLFFPVDVSTASRATLGGMAGNNSCGARSIRYGNMVHNVRAIDALLADGTRSRFEPLAGFSHPAPAAAAPGQGLVPDFHEKYAPGGDELASAGEGGRYATLVRGLLALGEREAREITARFPDLLRRVGGYNLDELLKNPPNLARLLVGSEGTLGFFQRIHLDLQAIPPHKVLGVCHFPTFYQAMDATQHIVTLKPSAVELVDRTMMDLAGDIPLFAATMDRFVRGKPGALLLVEFAGEERDVQLRGLRDLVELMATLGFPEAVVEATDDALQSAIWEVRKSGLNIMMSMKGDGKPVSFIEDCAVRLEDLAEYTSRLTDIFAKYGTTGTFYAHASVGCLHVRPVLNMKGEDGARKMRAIAEETMELVRAYKGSHSGEHGDGISRSEFHASMFGRRMVANFEEVKRLFDPDGRFNPGKIVKAPRMDDRTLMRYPPGYAAETIATTLDWSAWGGFHRALEMCNNNGACRKIGNGIMCPSYRATRDEQHLTRGRANTLRLAITGQLGPDALASPEMAATMALCISCKGCKRECPTGVDMARMKIEWLHHYHRHHPLTLRERLIAWLPRYAPRLRHWSWLLNARDRIPGLAKLSEGLLGFTSRRPLPRWRRDQFDQRREAAVTCLPSTTTPPPEHAPRDVVLLVDTFNTCFDPENARAALAVLRAAGYRVYCPTPDDRKRPLCCGRTFLSAGLVDEARAEATRMLDTLKPYVERDIPIVGLEPSCLLTLRDEFPAMLPGPETAALARQAVLFEEFLVAEQENRSGLSLSLHPVAAKQALLHGHCHQKAFGAMSSVERVLSWIPELEVTTLDAGCCGMAGSFGYEKEHYDISMKMGSLSLFPALRAAADEVLIVADGSSCRQQIHHGTGREAVHVARVLHAALKE